MPGRQSLASTKSAKHVGRVAAALVDELGERAPEPLLVLGADHLDEAHASRAGGAGTSPARCGPTPRGRWPATRDRGAARPCRRSARGDHLVPALGHRHEHHRRVPVEPEVDRSAATAAGRSAMPSPPSLSGQVEPPLGAGRVAVDVDEAGPRQRDAAGPAAAGEVLEHGLRGSGRAVRGRPRPRPRPARAMTSSSASNSAPSAARDGTGRPCGRRRGTTSTVPMRRPASRSSSNAAIAAPLVGRRDARPGVVAHDGEADRAVTDERGEVDAGTRGVDRVAVAVEVGPRPRHGVVEEVPGDVLDVGEEVGDLGPGWRRSRGRATGCSCRRASW